MLSILMPALLACKHPVTPTEAPPDALAWSALQPATSLAGFVVEGVYTGPDGRPRGARLRHLHTGFLIRWLEIETVPGAMIAVNTVPPDDRGTPHTQEHLLLGKGEVGRAVADAEAYQLVDSSAYTERLRTVYHFRTAAGPDAFFTTLEARLHALLEPDYTDTEIRREVYHLGVEGEPGARRLVEKGTVYNEMMTSSREEGRILWSRMERDLYGPDHPAARSSGGDPDAMRTLDPEAIRAFHASSYALGNMSAVLTLPPGDLEARLTRLDALLRGLQPEATPSGATWPSRDTLPSPHAAPDGPVHVVPYPRREGKGTVSTVLGWPPRGDRMPREALLLGLFFQALTGDTTSNLHHALIDRSTRERDTGARAVWGGAIRSRPGSPVLIGVDDLPPDAPPADVAWVRDRIVDELRRVAAWTPGDPDLEDFDRRVEAALVQRERQARMRLAEPLGFGTRGTGSGWLELLEDLDRDAVFAHDLAQAEDFAWVRARLGGSTNPWASLVASEGWLDRAPQIWQTRPDATLLEADEKALAARLEQAGRELEARFGTSDRQEALDALQGALDAESAALEAGKHPEPQSLVADAPMDPDPGLVTTQAAIEGVPVFHVRFGAMEGARAHLLFDLRSVPPAHHALLPALVPLLLEVGMEVDGEWLDADAVDARLKREVRYLWGSIESSGRTGRLELQVAAEGTSLPETREALAWIGRALASEPADPERIRTVLTAR
ncbi:MAG: hypothetical protein H6734_26385, partial [Alphaproteobacteria bacterium]|nr:hypothetical protein [Alphaproteobacteria bacterium]